MPRVFITSNRMRKDSFTKELKPTVDLRPAEQFGTLTSVFDHEMEPENQIDMNQAYNRLADFDCKSDYILPNGSPIATLATGMILADKGVGEIKTLIWDRMALKYNLKVISL